MSTIDFSKKCGVLIRNPEGDIQPIAQPYFRSTKLADGVWQILTDGDFVYVVAGENECLVIDTGYGSGDLKAYCEAMTGKPVKAAVNTGTSLRSSAGNCCFDVVCMSREAYEAKEKTLPSMEGVVIPEDYKVEFIEDGYTFDLGGREVIAIDFPCTSRGGMLYFDTKTKAMFTGAEINDFMVHLDYMSVPAMKARLEKMVGLQGEIDLVCCGKTVFFSYYIKRLLQNATRILEGAQPLDMIAYPGPSQPERDAAGNVIYNRGSIRPEDRVEDDPQELAHKKFSLIAESKIIYDDRRKLD